MDELKLPDFFVNITDKPGKEKITIGPIDFGKHLTFHFGTKSKTFDIHIKDEINNTYETIITIRYFSLYRLYALIKNDVSELINNTYSNHINLGKLRRYDCFLQPLMLNDTTTKIIKTNSNQNKYKFKKAISVNELTGLFIDLNDIDPNCESFIVYKFRKGKPIFNGMIFKRIDKETQNGFIYLSRKRVNQLRIGILKIFLENIVKLKNVESEKLVHSLSKKI
jgi:hypothetical protein